MFNSKDPKAKFQEDINSFNFAAALSQFVRDNITFCFLLLAVSAAAAVSNGARGILSHRRVGTILLIIFACRAYHAGTKHNRTVIIRDASEDTTHDPEQSKD